MKSTTHYALGIETTSGRWLALDDRISGPMLTRDPWRARRWESAEALLDWLEAIPDLVEVKGVPTSGGRKWMDDKPLYAVPVTTTVGEPRFLFRYEAPVLEEATR